MSSRSPTRRAAFEDADAELNAAPRVSCELPSDLAKTARLWRSAVSCRLSAKQSPLALARREGASGEGLESQEMRRYVVCGPPYFPVVEMDTPGGPCIPGAHP